MALHGIGGGTVEMVPHDLPERDEEQQAGQPADPPPRIQSEEGIRQEPILLLQAEQHQASDHTDYSQTG
jgi:hypothetical protein